MAVHVAILGAGYTGTRLIARLARRGDSIAASRRAPVPESAGLPATFFPFELSDPSSWTALPASECTVCLFPVDVLAMLPAFASMLAEKSRRTVVLGTTSSYGAASHAGPADVSTPLMRTPRVEGEELLREQGAVVLRCAGIYGPASGLRPARNPLDWLRAGRIADADRVVNLVHVEDVCTAIIGAMDAPCRGEQFIVSDGTPRSWGEIASWARAAGLPGVPDLPRRGGEGGRALSGGRVQQALGVRFEHTDLFAELLRLEGH
jgi:nucleoside-diphosphate-sugar epimerase